MMRIEREWGYSGCNIIVNRAFHGEVENRIYHFSAGIQGMIPENILFTDDRSGMDVLYAIIITQSDNHLKTVELFWLDNLLLFANISEKTDQENNEDYP